MNQQELITAHMDENAVIKLLLLSNVVNMLVAILANRLHQHMRLTIHEFNFWRKIDYENALI